MSSFKKDKLLLFGYCFMLLVFSGASVHAQDFKTDMMKVNRAFTGIDELSMDITYKIYQKCSSLSPYEVSKGSFYKKGTFQYSDMMGFETILTGDYLIVVSTEDEKIYLGEPVNISALKISPVNLEKVGGECSAVKKLATDKGIDGYRMEIKQETFSQYDVIEVWYNSKDYFIKKFVLYYREAVSMNELDEMLPKDKPRLEIIFTETGKNKTYPEDIFSETRYFIKKGDHYLPSQKYKGFQVINQKIQG